MLDPYQTQYLNHLKSKGLTHSTIEWETYIQKTYFQWLKTPTQHATPQTLQTYKTHLFTTNLSITRIRRILGRVKKYYYWLHDQNHILINPAINLQLPKTPKNTTVNIPNHTQILDLIHTTKKNNDPLATAVIELLYSTGIRRSELINLKIYDINLTQNTITIRQGKNKKDRVVPLGHHAKQALSNYITTQRPKHATPEDETLFFSYTSLPLSKHNIYYIFKKHTKNPIRPHALRHACASGMLKGGANIRHIQKILGHNLISTTQIYTKLEIEDLKEMYNKYHPREKYKESK